MRAQLVGVGGKGTNLAVHPQGHGKGVYAFSVACNGYANSTLEVSVSHSVSRVLPFPVSATLHIPVVCADPSRAKVSLAFTQVRG